MDRIVPEPDFAVLKEAGTQYALRHLRGDELFLIVEVADSSIALDRTVKGPLYARAIFVYSSCSDGVYREVRRFGEQETIAPGGLPTSAVPVSELLPPVSALGQVDHKFFSSELLFVSRAWHPCEPLHPDSCA